MERHMDINKRQRLKDLCSIEDIPITERMWGQTKKAAKDLNRNYFMKRYYCSIYYGYDGHKEMHSDHTLPGLLMDKLRRDYDEGYTLEIYDTDNERYIDLNTEIEIKVKRPTY